MEKISPFKFEWVPQHSIVASVTTEEACCDSTRYVMAENQPEYGQYTLIEGNHCSCFDYDSVQWEAMIYDEDEVIELMSAWWNKHQTYYEKHQRIFAGLVAQACFLYSQKHKFPGLWEWVEGEGMPELPEAE